ncbi:hypothetical protein BDU57DRAFT_24566 [Ampelomyces quisqualis]|uniref:Uncharacterized protein n=1 Tax=Ampelomyces quisqualis TaxID=50730 RepID=A0A6A5QY77_AMPQU|nr:hypothetical protein BDU57DRAFT_24566 [Ampelomyces quisqualis]
MFTSSLDDQPSTSHQLPAIKATPTYTNYLDLPTSEPTPLSKPPKAKPSPCNPLIPFHLPRTPSPRSAFKPHRPLSPAGKSTRTSPSPLSRLLGRSMRHTIPALRCVFATTGPADRRSRTCTRSHGVQERSGATVCGWCGAWICWGAEGGGLVSAGMRVDSSVRIARGSWKGVFCWVW